MLPGRQPNHASLVLPCGQPDHQLESTSLVLPGRQPNHASLVLPCRQPNHTSLVLPCRQPDHQVESTSLVLPCRQPNHTSLVLPCRQPDHQLESTSLVQPCRQPDHQLESTSLGLPCRQPDLQHRGARCDNPTILFYNNIKRIWKYDQIKINMMNNKSASMTFSILNVGARVRTWVQLCRWVLFRQQKNNPVDVHNGFFSSAVSFFFCESDFQLKWKFMQGASCKELLLFLCPKFPQLKNERIKHS